MFLDKPIYFGGRSVAMESPPSHDCGLRSFAPRHQRCLTSCRSLLRKIGTEWRSMPISLIHVGTMIFPIQLWFHCETHTKFGRGEILIHFLKLLCQCQYLNGTCHPWSSVIFCPCAYGKGLANLVFWKQGLYFDNMIGVYHVIKVVIIWLVFIMLFKNDDLR